MIFPRAEIGSSEVLTFEITNEAGLSSAGAFAMAGAGAFNAVGQQLDPADFVQGVLTAAGQGDMQFTGITFYATLNLGEDPMERVGEQRFMTRPGEGRAMETAAPTPLSRPGDNRGMTK